MDALKGNIFHGHHHPHHSGEKKNHLPLVQMKTIQVAPQSKILDLL